MSTTAPTSLTVEPAAPRLASGVVPDVGTLAGLNESQRAAATHPPHDRALLVLAGAGSGKTSTLAARVAWLVQQGADPQRLLLITFSRRAAGEMAARAARLLHRLAGLPASVAPPHLPWCGTFHGVAARLLRDEARHVGLNEGFTVLDRGDAEELMAQARQSAGLAETEGRARFPLAPTCLAIHSRCINTRAPLAEVLREHFPWCAVHEAALGSLFAAYAAAKRAQHSLDFDDLLLACWHLLQAPASASRLRARFDHVLVDEVQDVNALQADIVHALRPGGQGLTAVGDDAQAIYAFRGADPRHLRDLPARCTPQALVLTLTENYRSTPAILAAANAVIAQAAGGRALQLHSRRGEGLRPRLVTVADEAAEAHGVADAVLAEREAGILLRRQAVLFRTATHSAALELELVRRRVPFVKYGGLRFLEAAHVKDVVAVLRWADNPAARGAAARCARLVPGLGPASVARLLDGGGDLAAFKPPPAARAGWAALAQVMAQLRDEPAWPADLQRAIDWYQPHLERLHDDARVRRGDLDALLRLAGQHGSRHHFVTELTLDPPAATGDEAGPPHRDDDYLVLSTLHSAKGQEWSAVHLLRMVDGCMPADMATGRAAEIEEERRLLYVGMTRAKDSLTLWVPQRFHVTQQRAWGERHLYAPRTRFIGDELLAHFDQAVLTPPSQTGPSADAGPPLLDLTALLGSTWAGGSPGVQPTGSGPGQDPA
ncbi:MAG: ATP-dependent DNA helicase [Leptothrix sp. (in: Bacteria)]|nr:ATP-dependent DNA helicase [Leptothrix sp. (in: b-proteobacteria)]